MQYVGCGQGGYIAEQTYRYVGCGGDFSNVRRFRDFTCLICTILSILAMLLLAMLLLSGGGDAIDCKVDAALWQRKWSKNKQTYCCRHIGVGCEAPVVLPAPEIPTGPVDPFNCADGKLNWKSEWSVSKKQWCCKIHGSGCPKNGEGWDAVPAAQYDCDSAFANWVKGWSIPKKAWCCNQVGKGCEGDMTLEQAAGQGYGAGAEYHDRGAPIAAITGIVPASQRR